MKSKKEIKERIKDLQFSIEMAKKLKIDNLYDNYELEIEILKWVLDEDEEKWI